MAISQRCGESNDNGSIGSLQLSATDGSDNVPGPLGTLVQTPPAMFSQPHSVSGGNGSVGPPQIITANDVDGVPAPIFTPVKTTPMALGQPHSTLSSVAVPLKLSAVAPGKMLGVCNDTNIITKTCKSAFRAEGRMRGRRARRRNHLSERAAGPAAERTRHAVPREASA